MSITTNTDTVKTTTHVWPSVEAPAKRRVTHCRYAVVAKTTDGKVYNVMLTIKDPISHPSFPQEYQATWTWTAKQYEAVVGDLNGELDLGTPADIIKRVVDYIPPTFQPDIR